MWLSAKVMQTRLLGPKPQGVADEAENVGGGLDGEFFHGPSPSATGGQPAPVGFGRRSDREPPLGRRVRSATWGTGSDPKLCEEISDGGAPNEILGRERRVAPWLRGGPAPAMMGIRMTNSEEASVHSLILLGPAA